MTYYQIVKRKTKKMAEKQEPAAPVENKTEKQEPAAQVENRTEKQEPAAHVEDMTEKQEPAAQVENTTEKQEPATQEAGTQNPAPPERDLNTLPLDEMTHLEMCRFLDPWYDQDLALLRKIRKENARIRMEEKRRITAAAIAKLTKRVDDASHVAVKLRKFRPRPRTRSEKDRAAAIAFRQGPLVTMKPRSEEERRILTMKPRTEEDKRLYIEAWRRHEEEVIKHAWEMLKAGRLHELRVEVRRPVARGDEIPPAAEEKDKKKTPPAVEEKGKTPPAVEEKEKTPPAKEKEKAAAENALANTPPDEEKGQAASEKAASVNTESSEADTEPSNLPAPKKILHESDVEDELRTVRVW